ncbi:hypothetical protein BHE74_00059333 [Ensete ventricosum]|nr:hypothetical protein BHE74_00059333 [Ensete ventricosum]
MHPLRFPDSGIRAKGSEEEGRPATTSPHVGPATHGQADCKGLPTTVEGPPASGRPATARPPTRGGHPQAQQPASGQSSTGATPTGRSPVGRSTPRCQRPARKGLLAHDEAVGAAPARGQPTEGRCPQRRRLRAQRRSQGRMSAGKGNCCLRRGSDDGDAEGVRASFGKRMILPL